MSLIGNQIARLRRLAQNEFGTELGKELRNAADTIEELSAKLHTANMERSTAYYNGGWIPISEHTPQEVGNYIIHTIDGNDEDYVGMWYYCRGEYLGSKQYYIDDKHGYWANAWSGEPIGEQISKRCVA